MAEEEQPQLPKLTIMETCPIDFGECKKREEIEKEFNPSQVFLDIPYSGYKKEYEEAIRKAIESFGLTPVLAETNVKVEGLLCNVCKTIQKSGYVIADISGYNPNVMYELGTISALCKKYCILCDSDTKVPIDLAGLVINKYKDKVEIEKNVSKWIAENVCDIAIRIAKQRKIFGYIFYDLKKKDLRFISQRIEEIKQIGDLKLLITQYNLLIEKLIDLLKNEDFDIQEKAIGALSYSNDERIIEPIITALKDFDSSLKKETVEAYNKVGKDWNVYSSFNIINEKYRIYKYRVSDALGSVGEAAINPLIEALNDESSLIRCIAAYTLGNIGATSAVNTLIKMLKDNNPDVRWNVVRALGKICDKRAVNPLIATLKDRNPNVRTEVANTLGNLGDARAIEHLIACKEDMADYENKYYFTRAIEKIIFAQKEKME